MDCADERTQKTFFLQYKDTDKFVAMPPEDAHSFLNWCEQKAAK